LISDRLLRPFNLKSKAQQLLPAMDSRLWIYLAIVVTFIILVLLGITYGRRRHYVVAEPVNVSLTRRPFQPYEAYKPYGPYATLGPVFEPPPAYTSLVSGPPQAAHTSSHPQVLEEVVGTNGPAESTQEAEEDHERPSNGSWNPLQRWGSVRTQDRQSGKEAMRPRDLELQGPRGYRGGSDVPML
jgi:hypothetical protein